MHIVLKLLNGPHKGKKYLVRDGETKRVGRGSAADIIVSEGMVSRLHCEVENQDGHIQITDLASSNGTFVNDRSIKSETLTAGDRLRVGGAIFEVRGVETGVVERLDDSEPQVVVEKSGRAARARELPQPANERTNSVPPDLPQPQIVEPADSLQEALIELSEPPNDFSVEPASSDAPTLEFDSDLLLPVSEDLPQPPGEGPSELADPFLEPSPTKASGDSDSKVDLEIVSPDAVWNYSPEEQAEEATPPIQSSGAETEEKDQEDDLTSSFPVPDVLPAEIEPVAGLEEKQPLPGTENEGEAQSREPRGFETKFYEFSALQPLILEPIDESGPGED